MTPRAHRRLAFLRFASLRFAFRRSSKRAVGVATGSACVIVAAAWYFAAGRAPAGGVPAQLGAAVFVPASAAEIVERLPAAATASKQDLRQRSRAAPGNGGSVAGAVAMARRHLERARRDGDPREAALARSALGDWWDLPAAPVPVLLVRAAIRQHGHDFDGALADLERALSVDPRNVQAWLSRAAAQQTTGRLRAAADSCRRVVALSDHDAGHVCLADLASMQGDRGALDRIARRLADRQAGAAAAAWILTVQAEMAERLGRNAEAEAWFRAAVGTAGDSYARVAYADLLLATDRAGQVDALLAPAPATDAVLLRRAIGLLRTGDPRAAAVVDELRRRFAPPAGEAVAMHLREMARFFLEIEGDAATALELATRNWSLQKEPADALLLAAAARAAGRPGAAAPVRAFVRDPGLFDVRLHEQLE